MSVVSHSPERAKRNWAKVSNVIRGINLMKKTEVKTIKDAGEIISDIGASPLKSANKSVGRVSSKNGFAL